MRWHLKELIGRAESVTRRSISYREISAATGISPTTITRIATGQTERADLGTIDGLLTFFEDLLKEPLTTDDLLRHYREEPGQTPTLQ